MNYLAQTGCALLFFATGVSSLSVANFTSQRSLSLPAPQNAIATGDLNQDSIPDIIVTGDPVSGESGKMRIFLGRGNGNFHFLAESVVGAASPQA